MTNKRETLTLKTIDQRYTDRNNETQWRFIDPKTGIYYDWFTTSFRHFPKGELVTFTATTYEYEGRRVIVNPRGFGKN